MINSKGIRNPEMDKLMDAMLTLKSRDEAYLFFEDLCTVGEMAAISQRFEVAKLLKEERTYTEISEATGASTATISRVNRTLNYGDGGYELIMNRIAEAENK